MLLAVSLFCGVLFGLGLTISDMVNPQRVINFLDITGAWDPTLAFVMIGALAVFMPGYFLLIKPRSHSVLGNPITVVTSKQIDIKLLSGAALFGIGWGLVGICPGPALALLFSGGLGIWIFVAALCAGALLADHLLYN